MRTNPRSGGRPGGTKTVSPNEIVINAMAGETRVAILEQGVFTELHIERDAERSVTGTVVLGRVSRVLPGMRMGGHMGHERVTVRNLEVIEVDTEDNLLVVKGAVPGPNGGYVLVKRAQR